MATSEVRITVSLPGAREEDLTLSYPLDSRHGELLWEIHDHHAGGRVVECRMHDDDPRLADLRDADGRVHGIWLTVCQHPHDRDRLYLRHWPNSPVLGSHDVPRPMTVEHIRGQEYIAERGRDFGYGVVCNRAFSTENLCRADVRVAGSVATLAAEVQVSKIGAASVLDRTRRAAKAGATSVWFPRMENPPPWQFQVPCISTNEVLTIGPRTWSVTTGARALEDEQCVPGSRFERCPLGKVRHCRKHHPLWVPMPLVTGRRETVDDIVERFPDGGLVRVETGTRQGVVLATPADREKWLAHRAELEVPAGRSTPAPQRQSAGGLRHSEYPADRLRKRIERARDRGARGPWCETCTPLMSGPTLPPRFGSCSLCTGPKARDFLLADARAGRSCEVCGEPLPRAVVHMTVHRDCEGVGESRAAA